MTINSSQLSAADRAAYLSNFSLDNGTFLNSTAVNQSHNIFSGRHTELITWLTVTGGTTYVGAAVSFLLLLAVWPQRSQRSNFNLLICHFVALHFFMCFVNIPMVMFMVLAKYDNRWTPADICVHIHSLTALNVTLINWSDVGLSINRCVALLFPHQYAAWNTKTGSIALISLAWIVCGGMRVAYPILLDLRTVHVRLPAGDCAYRSTPQDHISQVTVFISVVIPYTLTGLGAVLILLRSIHLAYRSNTVGGPSQRSSALRQRLKLAKMLLLTFLWTAICNTPNYVVLYSFRPVLNGLAFSGLWMRVKDPFQYGFTPCILLLSNAKYRERLARKLKLYKDDGTNRASRTAQSYVGATAGRMEFPLRENRDRRIVS